MTTPTNRYRIRQMPTDVWSIRERLCLASSVLRSGDQNWVSVSRAIKPFGEPNRPPDWFSQKNCALQYSDLLEKIESPKRKRWDRADKETPGDLIVRKLTSERIEELKKSIQEKQIKHRKLKGEIEMVRCGHVDDQLDDVLNRIKDEMKAKDDSEKEHKKWLEHREEQIAAMKAMPRISALTKKKVPGKISRVGELKRRNSSQSEQSEQDSAVDSPISEPHSMDIDDITSPLASAFEGLPITPIKMAPPSSTSASYQSTPSTSPLLTSLLKSPTPTAPASPMGSLLGSPSSQPKEGTLASQLSSPRTPSTPQTFFNPSSALATAAARQLAVATASSSLFPNDKQDTSPTSSSALSIPPPHSVTLSAPTLSKLLEMPPSVPGKLPPLPIIHPPTSTPAPVTPNIPPNPEDTPTFVLKKPSPVSERQNLSSPVISSEDNLALFDAASVVVKKEPPETILSSPLPSVDISKDIFQEEETINKADVTSTPTKLPDPIPTGSSTKENSAVEVVNTHTTDIVIESKGGEASQEEEQVIVMEVDFAGQVKDEKGELIEVFEVTAPEGSIVELEYETICEEEPEKIERLEIISEGKTLEETAGESSQVAEIKDVSTDAQSTKEVSVDEKLPDDESKPSEEESKEVHKSDESVPVNEEKAEEVDKVNKPVLQPKASKASEKSELDVSPKKDGVSPKKNGISPKKDGISPKKDGVSPMKDEASTSGKGELEKGADVQPISEFESAKSKETQLCVVEDAKEVDVTPASIPKSPTLRDQKSHLTKSAIEPETEKQTMTISKEIEGKDDQELLNEKLPESPIRSSKRPPAKRGRRGRSRGGGKTLTNVALEPKPYEDDATKGKDDDDDDEEEEEQKMELDRVESAAESEISEVVSPVDQSAESVAEPVSDAAAEASGDSDGNFTSNESEYVSKVKLERCESLEGSTADQSQISVESEDKHQATSSVTDSIPNSPASTAPSDDQESIREYKVWKKAIMLVWRAAANHKFASVFLHPVTNDVAPGYHGIVYRPMDLSVIKKNIENGAIRSTLEFQRDVMLMFQNAIMYNSSDHDVYHMALEMQKEVMEQIQDFLATQLMLQTAELKVLRKREREAHEKKSESIEIKEEEFKRKRTSTSNSDTEVKVKKRKII